MWYGFAQTFEIICMAADYTSLDGWGSWEVQQSGLPSIGGGTNSLELHS